MLLPDLVARLRRIAFGLLPLALLTLIVGCGTRFTTPLDELVDVGDHRLHVECQGQSESGVTVIVDVGLGGTIDSWRSIQQELAQNTCVCLYERAGYGQSETGPLPRDSHQEAEELVALLRAVDAPQHYILVGHSLGALNMQVLAHDHPDLVAGVVLLDPPPLDWLAGNSFHDLYALAQQETESMALAAEAMARSEDPDERRQAAFVETLASEHAQMFQSSLSQVLKITDFGNLPLVVIASGQPNPHFGQWAADYQNYWIAQSLALAQRSTQGRFVLAPDSSHAINVDAPDVVAQAVRSLLPSR